MSIFKRLSATLVSRIDQVVGEIENHDAVIQATLDDLTKKAAQAKLRLSQARREEQRLTQQMETEEEQARLWRRRAMACAQDNEAKALECMRRAQQCSNKKQRLEQSLSLSRQTTDRLTQDIETNELRLVEIKQRLTLMRARDASSAASHAGGDMDVDTARLIEETFDRWEISVGQSELLSDVPDISDPIEREFTAREQERALRDELDALLAEENKQ